MGRRWGQHFLRARGIASLIARNAAHTGVSGVIEIGAGTGVLTEALLAESFATVVAIEIDPSLVAVLQNRFAHHPRFRIIPGDVRHLSLAEVAPTVPYTVVGNIPYYLTGRLIRTLFEARPLPVAAYMLVQQEVAERIAHAHKTSLPALWVRLHGTPRILRKVPPTAFVPPPAVRSAVLAIEEIHASPDAHAVMWLARRAFRTPRKQLASALRPWFSLPTIHRALCHIGAPPSVRAEDLSLNAWRQLARHLLPHAPPNEHPPYPPEHDR